MNTVAAFLGIGLKITMILIGSQINMSENIIASMNAFRCMFASIFTNTYMLMIAAYLVAEFYDVERVFLNVVRKSYPYLCTCVEDSDMIVSWVGIPDSHADYYDALDHCSEAGWDFEEQLEWGAQMELLWSADPIVYQDIATAIMGKVDVDSDSLLTAAEMANALFYEYQITANAREQTFVETLLGELCGTYDAAGDGLDNSELISCLEAHGQEIWTGAAEWAESRAGAYDADVWYEALDGADTDADG
jgi:hypothetical protein